ncbi:hypothetical protein VWZ63_00735 [Phaeobacter sp. JH207A]|uniref:LexA family protein n=2 Tax=unclassified Phaeobacter TaxID=2621772 RepID=UPI003A849000
MKYGLTARQAQCLAFIKQQLRGGVSPSYDEIADHMGLASKHGAHHYVHMLVKRGYIEILPNCKRSIRLLGGDLEGMLNQIDATAIAMLLGEMPFPDGADEIRDLVAAIRKDEAHNG